MLKIPHTGVIEHNEIKSVYLDVSYLIALIAFLVPRGCKLMEEKNNHQLYPAINSVRYNNGKPAPLVQLWSET